MFNYVQKAFVVRALCFLGGILQVELMLANYSYVVLVTFFLPVPYFYLCTSYVKNRKQKKRQQKQKKRN